MFCEAYKTGLYGEKIQWLIVGGYTARWWARAREAGQTLDCSQAEVSKYRSLILWRHHLQFSLIQKSFKRLVALLFIMLNVMVGHILGSAQPGHTPHLTFLFYFAANLFFNFHFENALQCCWQPLDNPSRWPMVQWSLKFRLIWKYLSLFLSSSHKNVTCTFVTTSVSDPGQVQTNCCEIEKKCEMSQWKKEMRRC